MEKKPLQAVCAQGCAELSAELCAALCAGLVRTVVRMQLCACVQTVVRRKVVRRSCAHTVLALAAVHKYQDLCAPHCASIRKSVHNPFWSGTMF